jgi:redox-sensing transcriptional repressor
MGTARMGFGSAARAVESLDEAAAETDMVGAFDPAVLARNGRRAVYPIEAATGGAIPDIVIRRLPVYVRTLRALRDHGIRSVSSDELADHIGVTAAQIRRDLSYFGRFGKQGKGYDTAFLADAIAEILGLDQQWDVALAGLGNLGRAIVRYRGFGASSFNIVVLFDSQPERIGQDVGDLTVLPDDRITEIIRREGIRIGIVAVPADAAQQVADQMIAGGVRAILNYAPVVLKVPPGVIVREIDPVSALQSMTYYLGEAEPPV